MKTIAVRLPLQIGTSSLWSISRASATLIPGLGLAIGSLPLVMFGGFAVTAGLCVMGGLLVYFAGMHLVLAVRERPSDVVLRSEGLIIEGGVHDSRHISWAQIVPERTTLTIEKERRYTLARILGNGLAVMLMMMARRKVFWIERKEFDIARLRLGLTDGTQILIAEAERPIEKESLAALHDAICSTGWHPPQPGAKKRPVGTRHTTMGISVLFCPRCGAPAIPDDQPAVPCRYCGAQVPMPPTMRERVAADLRLRAGKSTSERLIGKLLQQPGARPTGKKLLAAAVVMMAAWPLSVGLAALELDSGFYEVPGLVSLTIFPVATILGLFFLLRGALLDRFALRLLTLDFGAQHPRKEGDPYMCRRCDAPLPDEPGKVLVPCRYCGADNIVGIDLRRQAANATREAVSLEGALAQRNKERQLWGILSVVAIVLMIGGAGALAHGVSAMIDFGEEVKAGKVTKPSRPGGKAIVAPAATVRKVAPKPAPSSGGARR